MASDWRSSTWGAEISLEYGKALRGYDEGPGAYRVFGSNGPIGWTSEPLAPGPGVILGRKGAYRGIHYSADPFFVIDTAYYVVPKNELDMRWLYYAMRHYKLGQIDDGSPIPSTTRPAVYVREFSVPTPSEQHAVAHILGTLDDKIELNRRMNDTLEAMARALFKSWFVDFDPVRAKAQGRNPGLPKHLADLFPDSFEESELGEIPRGWKIGELPNEIDFLEGPGIRNRQYRPEGMRFLNIRCIADGDLLTEKANFIGDVEFREKYSHFGLCADDIVISTSGTLGRFAIVRKDHLPIMLNTSIIRMRGRHPVGLGYVWGTLGSEYFQQEMLAHASGSVQLNFGPIHLRRISILRPPDAVLGAYERIAGPLLKASAQNRVQCHTLAALRDALLPKLISGALLLPNPTRFKENIR